MFYHDGVIRPGRWYCDITWSSWALSYAARLSLYTLMMSLIRCLCRCSSVNSASSSLASCCSLYVSICFLKWWWWWWWTMNLVVQQEVTFDPGLQTPQCPWRTDCHKDASVASWNLHCVPLPLVIERQSQVFHVVFPLLQQFLHMFLLRCPQTLHMLEVNTPCLNPLTLPLLKFLPQTLQHRQEVSELA